MRLDSAQNPRRSTISLTPLIDVVFILLLFFMLTSRFQHYQAMPLNVPAVDTATLVQSDVVPLLIELQSDSNISINGSAPVEQSQLASSAIVNRAIAEELSVHVSTSTGVTLSMLTRLMDRLSATGLTRVSLQEIR